jgi:hypothetical protein
MRDLGLIREVNSLNRTRHPIYTEETVVAEIEY